MSHSVLCPICGGWGKVPKEYKDFKEWMNTSKSNEPKDPVTCWGCQSKGWVEVGYSWYNPVPWFPQYQWFPAPDITPNPTVPTVHVQYKYRFNDPKSTAPKPDGSG